MITSFHFLSLISERKIQLQIAKGDLHDARKRCDEFLMLLKPAATLNRFEIEIIRQRY